jgi:hypothetical protein
VITLEEIFTNIDLLLRYRHLGREETARNDFQSATNGLRSTATDKTVLQILTFLDDKEWKGGLRYEQFAGESERSGIPSF